MGPVMLVRRDAAARVHSALVGIALAGLALYAGAIAADVVMPEIVDVLLFHLPIAISGLACLVAARRRLEMRKAWTAFGLGLIVWAVADSYLLLFLDDSTPTFPSLPDAGFLLTLFLFYLGAVYLTRSFDRRSSTYQWLDGAIAALGVLALAIALIAPAVAGDRAIGDSAAAVNFTYPVADLVLLGLVLAAMVVNGQTGSRTLLTVSAGPGALGRRRHDLPDRGLRRHLRGRPGRPRLARRGLADRARLAARRRPDPCGEAVGRPLVPGDPGDLLAGSP